MDFKKILLLLVTIGMLFFLVSGCACMTEPPEEIGRAGSQSGGGSAEGSSSSPAIPAPEFTLNSLDGREVSLSDFRGKVVVLNFWATWCGTCRAEMPNLERAYQAYKDKNVELVGISMDTDTQLVESFVKEVGVTYTILLDPSHRVASDYAIWALPSTYIVDEKGMIVGSEIGQLAESMLKNMLDQALEE
ncbi:peroxiredoxin family protein [Candidatus Hakubella thermalkaliphila]|uniref:Cytochrome c biogenesis protein CcmG, thiol:disulfide interchange protein DsbE n=2 Tax=Candidatus Hakubella thermalkaliphila TaxID=2754717 RepID=A0A6V8Q2R0_9ACTN|nr:TlpA disulfide reductase family protein [Candidatus Hakubella thermalkaliphila]GFP30602.1 cytochrome c biogenesis protein CcmG, thiol:disulfide interchange protein DsbE [Candidatus Hakubella thermalkaliphila]GFP38793.1 cytochrome c biogenesis protein CcmG, thiol:disulfide interchange protein DsbE [Candidatus Hakubella thermalkaliphila]